MGYSNGNSFGAGSQTVTGAYKPPARQLPYVWFPVCIWNDRPGLPA